MLHDTMLSKMKYENMAEMSEYARAGGNATGRARDGVCRIR